MKGNYKETMSLKALANKVLTGNQAGNHEETTLRKEETSEETSGQKFPKKFPISVTRIDKKQCQGCPYYDTGQTPDGRGIIQWCGPWRHSNGDEHWFNIAELKVCPLILRSLMQEAKKRSQLRCNMFKLKKGIRVPLVGKPYSKLRRFISLRFAGAFTRKDMQRSDGTIDTVRTAIDREKARQKMASLTPEEKSLQKNWTIFKPLSELSQGLWELARAQYTEI
jgi:hypothetical protein